VTSAEAPFYSDVAEAPEGVAVRWLTAADGVRLRAAVWREGVKGTVLLFPGRTEYVEKYGPAASELRARGYAMATIDWRGQGLADRLVSDRAAGHVRSFADYQHDVAALMAFVRAEGLPGPFFLIAHSMGGAIGLRAIYRHLPVRAVAFSAPMWGIRIHPALRPVAWALSTASRTVGRGHRYAPGTSPVTYVAAAPFADNMLTRDEGMFAFMQRQVHTHPDLALGGPSLHWLNAALLECFDLQRKPSPRLPCYTALGLLDRIVDTQPIRVRMGRWPGARFDLIPGVEHEVMMETPTVRKQFYDAAVALFDAHQG
jgi:lysophospholipase